MHTSLWPPILFKHKFMKKLTVLLLLLCCVQGASAETTRYVTDALTVPLRAGAGDRFKIIQALPSGSPVTILRVDAKSGYSQVAAADGKRGWIANRDLMDTPGGRENATRLQQALEQAKADNARLQAEFNKLAPGSGDALTRYSQLLEDNERLSQELARFKKLANSPVDLDRQNRLLEERIVTLERDLQIARQESQALTDSRQNTLFLLGAGVLVAGLLLGWLLAGRSVTRQQPWGEL